MRAILDVVLIILQIYSWVVIAAVIVSWLIAFNVINMRNDLVAAIVNIIVQLTEPLLAPLRRFLPNLGGLDLSPLALLLAVFLVQRIIVYYIYPNVF